MRSLLLLAFATLAACGGGSGIAESKLIVDLSDTEIEDLCDYIIEQQGDARTEVCMDDTGEFTVDFPSFDECVDTLLGYIDGCTATVRQEEECAERLGDDPCADPTACHTADDC